MEVVNTDGDKVVTVNYETFRVNHFEVFITELGNDNITYNADALRLFVSNVKLNKLSGEVVVDMYACEDVFLFTDSLYMNEKLHLKYLVYNNDGSDVHTIFNNDVRVKDVELYSDYSGTDAMHVKLICGFGAGVSKHLV
jgi:hypothetical protein